MTAPATADGVPGHPSGLTGVKNSRRRWAKSDATQVRILNAAAAVFREHGYTAATIGDVVAASGASIGSIYHHFGGKSELFLAIHERLSTAVGQNIAHCGRAATEAASPLTAFTASSSTASSFRASSFTACFDAQARGYLEAVWANRQIAVILATDDVPPGYERIRRDSMQAWFRDWLAELDIDSGAAGALLTRALIAVLTESAAQVMAAEDVDAAAVVMDAAIEHLNRLLT